MILHQTPIEHVHLLGQGLDEPGNVELRFVLFLALLGDEQDAADGEDGQDAHTGPLPAVDLLMLVLMSGRRLHGDGQDGEQQQGCREKDGDTALKADEREILPDEDDAVRRGKEHHQADDKHQQDRFQHRPLLIFTEIHLKDIP